MSTLKQIAEDLNVSIGTVSRILNGKSKESRISEKTVETVLKYAEEIGYAPNLIAKGLQASQTFTIGYRNLKAPEKLKEEKPPILQ